MNLEKHLDSATHFLRDLAAELDNPKDIDHAGRVLRSVFQVMRERLTLEESFDLLASLPMLMKGLYVDGWQPLTQGEKLRNVEEFVEAVRQADQRAADRDFGTQTEARNNVAAVFRVLKKYCALGEALDIRATLPRELRDFWISA